MLKSAVVRSTLQTRLSSSLFLNSGQDHLEAELFGGLSRRTVPRRTRRSPVIQSKDSLPPMFRQLSSHKPLLSKSIVEPPSYGLFDGVRPGGFTKDGKFRKESPPPPPPQSASSAALPAPPPEGDPNIIRPISAFEGLAKVAGVDADIKDAVSRRSPSDVSKQEVKRRAAVAGIDQGRLVEAWEVADPDSRFAEFQGVYLHYKIKEPREGKRDAKEPRDAQGRLVRSIDRLGSEMVAGGTRAAAEPGASSSAESREASRSGRLPSIFLHGFGASSFSWERVMQQIADLTGGAALSFDRPAFGLSARVEAKKLPVNPYSEKFSAAATLAFVDFLGAKKAILIAHSAGAVVALSAYFQAPEKIAALILVAPAIFPKAVKPSQQKEVTSTDPVPFWKLPFVWAKQAGRAVVSAVKGVVRIFRQGLGILGLALAVIIVRSRAAAWALRLILNRVGEAGVKSAWFDPEACTQEVLDAYKKPLKVRGWERGLLEFVLASMGGSPGSELPLGHRLGEVTCPVLVVTGDSDRLVPTWNSKKIEEALPNGQLRIIRKCGHLPQEEKPEEFLAAVKDFFRDDLTVTNEHAASQNFDITSTQTA